MTVAVCSGGGGGVRAADFKEYVVYYDLKEVRVVSMGTGTDVESFTHMEEVSLADYGHLEEVSFTFAKISIDYTAQGGAVETLECGGADWNDCTWATP
jgi:type VI protein secretion system component Hcp